MAEVNFNIRQHAQSLQDQLGGLKLLALHHIGKARVTFEQAMVEGGDQFAGGPVPELEDRRHQPDARHVVGQAAVGQKLERRRMGGGGARIGLWRLVLVEQRDRNAMPSQQPGAQQPDRAPAGDQHAFCVTAHARSRTLVRAPALDQAAVDVEQVEAAADGLVDDVVDGLGLMIEGRHRRHDDGAVLGGRQHAFQMAGV